MSAAVQRTRWRCIPGLGCSRRIETVNIYDVASGTLLDTRTVTNFTNGQYLVWNITGNVNVQIGFTAGTNAVVSGNLFRRAASSSGPPPATSARSLHPATHPLKVAGKASTEATDSM